VAPYLTAALEPEPDARRFFESLATFYQQELRALDRERQASRDARQAIVEQSQPSRSARENADQTRWCHPWA